MSRKILLLLTWTLLSSSCVAPAPPAVLASSKPGWGQVHSTRAVKVTVRAVPASAAPTVPFTRTGKPGWGRD